MAITSQVYGKTALSLGSKLMNLAADDIYMYLLDSSYTPNIDTHQFVSDLSGEISDPSYTTGGEQLDSVTFTYNSTTNKAVLDAADETLGGVVPGVRYIVCADKTPSTDATRPLICYFDLGADTAVPAVIWPSTGICALAV